METYLYQPTDHFLIKLKRIREQDRQGYERIKKVVERLLANPDDADGQMRGIHRGTYKKYVGRKDYRLIYYYCDLCRKANRRLSTRCENCDTIPDRSVVFFDVFHKNESTKLGY